MERDQAVQSGRERTTAMMKKKMEVVKMAPKL